MFEAFHPSCPPCYTITLMNKCSLALLLLASVVSSPVMGQETTVDESLTTADRAINPGQGRYLTPGSGQVLEKGSGIVSFNPSMSQASWVLADGFEVWAGAPMFFLLPRNSTSGGLNWNHAIGHGVTFNSSISAFRELKLESLEIGRGVIVRSGTIGLTIGEGDHHASLGTGYGSKSTPDSEVLYKSTGDWIPVVPIHFAGQVRVSERLALVTDNQVFLAPSQHAGSIWNSAELLNVAITARLFAKKRASHYQRTSTGDPVGYWDLGLYYKSAADHYEFLGQASEYSPLGLTAWFPWIGYTLNSAAVRDRRKSRREAQQ